jgi:hypothetical protein
MISIDEEIELAKNTELETLKAQVATLAAEVADLRSKQPPPEKLLTEADMIHYGHQRPTLSLPKVDWMPSRDELKALAEVIYRSYPYLVTPTGAWLDQFRVCLLAVNHLGRTEKPNQEGGRHIGEWLTNHRYFGEIDRGPLMSAICAAGDIKFSGYGERDMLAGTYPMSGIAAPNTGSPPDRSAWRQVLAEKRLTGETMAAQIMDGKPDRWDNPRSHTELLPHIDATKGY